MTDGEHGGHSAIRVTLHGDMASDVDVDALKKWLERERSLEVWIKDNKLRIHERARTHEGTGGDGDDSTTTMGAGMEIVLVMIGAVTPRLFDAMLTATKAGVDAWRENRRSVERGTPPVPEVTPHAPPENGPDAADNGEE